MEETNVVKINNDNMSLIKEKFAKNASKSELDLLLYMSNKYKLDILTRQIFLVKYGKNPASIFAGRDGFLSIAHRSGQFNGMQTTMTKEGEELAANCRVYRKDMEHPIDITVYMSEYNKNTPIWKEKPRTMLQKVAESQALRKAFDISGIYDPDEMPAVKGESPAEVEVKVGEDDFNINDFKKDKMKPEVHELPKEIREAAFPNQPDYINTGEDVPKSYWDDRDKSIIGGEGFFPKKIDGKWKICKNA